MVIEKKLKLILITLFVVINLALISAPAALRYEIDIEDVPGQVTFMGDVLSLWDSNVKNMTDTIMVSPWEWSRGEKVVEIVNRITESLIVIAMQLTGIFSLIGLFSTASTYVETQKPEFIVKALIRFVVAIFLVRHGAEAMQWIWSVVSGIISKLNIAVTETDLVIPKTICDCVANLGFLEGAVAWVLALICNVGILAFLGFLIVTVYLRFFKFYIFMALIPLAASTTAAANTQQHGLSFLKNYIGLMLEGVIIVLAFIVFAAFSSDGRPLFTGIAAYTGLGGFAVYVAERLVFGSILVIIVKSADSIIQRAFAL